MKTAISLDGELLREADQAAQRLGLSRSRLFSLALENYLRQQRLEGMLDQLNQVYGDGAERRTVSRMKAKFRSTVKDRW